MEEPAVTILYPVFKYMSAKLKKGGTSSLAVKYDVSTAENENQDNVAVRNRLRKTMRDP